MVVNFDMYDFLLRGDKSKDIRLQPEDVIFIPPIGPMVAIGSPKTLQEAQEALRTLARLQLEGEATPEMSWRRGEDLKIMSKPIRKGNLMPAAPGGEYQTNFRHGTTRGRAKIGHEQGHGFWRCGKGSGDLRT